jgi:hypothetical protein
MIKNCIQCKSCDILYGPTYLVCSCCFVPYAITSKETRKLYPMERIFDVLVVGAGEKANLKDNLH